MGSEEGRASGWLLSLLELGALGDFGRGSSRQNLLALGAFVGFGRGSSSEKIDLSRYNTPPPPTPRLNLHGFLPRLELIVTKILSHLLILPAPPSPMAFPSYVSYVLVKTNLKMDVA